MKLTIATLNVHLLIFRTKVRLGEYDLSKDKDCEDNVCANTVQEIDVEEEVCHLQYNHTLQENDICLIRLAEPIQFNGKQYCLVKYLKFLQKLLQH